MLEYKVRILKGLFSKAEKIEARHTEELNALAREGWRIVSTVCVGDTCIYVTLERETDGLPSF